jgi:hypothetical protein
MALRLGDRFRCMQNRQSIIWFEIGRHNAKSTLRMASEQTIGAPDDCAIRENLRIYPIRWGRTLSSRADFLRLSPFRERGGRDTLLLIVQLLVL